MNGKKDRQLTVRLRSDDLEMIKAASDRLWPGAPITMSAAVVELAKQRAKEILGKPKK